MYTFLTDTPGIVIYFWSEARGDEVFDRCRLECRCRSRSDKFDYVPDSRAAPRLYPDQICSARLLDFPTSLRLHILLRTGHTGHAVERQYCVDPILLHFPH